MDSAPYSCFFSATLGHFLAPGPYGPGPGSAGGDGRRAQGTPRDNPQAGGGPPVEPSAPVAAVARGS
jgi:hypothetical protein